MLERMMMMMKLGGSLTETLGGKKILKDLDLLGCYNYC